MYLARGNSMIEIRNVLIADTLIKRFMGYMFRKRPHHEAILIIPCNSIHTFFMRFNIDALFLNDNMEVVKVIKNLNPGKVIMPVRDAKSVLEAMSGKFENIKVGDIIDIL
jgi:uncharacterized membrane protein (UPF0127 family)